MSTMQDQMGEPRRYAFTATVTVEAESPEAAAVKAEKFANTIGEETGPGAFFCGVSVALEDSEPEVQED